MLREQMSGLLGYPYQPQRKVSIAMCGKYPNDIYIRFCDTGSPKFKVAT